MFIYNYLLINNIRASLNYFNDISLKYNKIWAGFFVGIEILSQIKITSYEYLFGFHPHWHTFCTYKSNSSLVRAMSCSEKEGREENLKLIALAFCFLG